MIVAMDLHGSLSVWPQLRELAAALSVGHQVHVVSALGNDDPHESTYRTILGQWGIPFAGIHFVRFAGAPTPEVAYGVGKLKVEVMQKVGATILFDDNPHICRAVRDAGLMPCQLMPAMGG